MLPNAFADLAVYIAIADFEVASYGMKSSELADEECGEWSQWLESKKDDKQRMML